MGIQEKTESFSLISGFYPDSKQGALREVQVEPGK